MFVISLVRAKRPQIRYLHVPIVTLILMVTVCPLSCYVESIPLESPTWDANPSDSLNSNSSPDDSLPSSPLSSASSSSSSSSNELQSKTINIQPSLMMEDEPLEMLSSSDELMLMNPQLYRLYMIRNGLITSQTPQASSSSSTSSSTRTRSKKALSLFAHWRPAYGQRPKVPAALSRREGRPFGKTLRWGR